MSGGVLRYTISRLSCQQAISSTSYRMLTGITPTSTQQAGIIPPPQAIRAWIQTMRLITTDETLCFASRRWTRSPVLIIIPIGRKSTPNHFETTEKRPDGSEVSRSLPGRTYHLPSLPSPLQREAYFAPRGGILDRIEAKFKDMSKIVLCGKSGNG